MTCSKKETASSYIDAFTSSVNSGKRAGIDAVELIEVVEAEPLAEELGGEAARFGIGEHALHLALQLLRIAQFTGGRGAPQFGIGNRRPEEEAQAARHFPVW